MSALIKAGEVVAGLKNWSSALRSNSVLRDLAFVLVCTVPALMVAIHYDAFDEFYEFSRQHEDWEL